MVFPQVIAGFHALFNVIGLPGNLLVIVTIALERRFHVMRYILLASLAVSDFLCLILVNSFRIASIAQEKWLYGQTMCYLNPFFLRYFYFNTILHLIAVSYERYNAIVKSPLTYDGTITKSKVVFIVFIWIVPVPFSIGPFLGLGNFVYNPEVFFCEQGWSVQSDSVAGNITFLAVITFIVPFLIIVFLNYRVFKTARILQRITVVTPGQVQFPASSENQQMSRTVRERKASIDVSIIIAAFVLCFLPGWITGLCRQFARSTTVPTEAILTTTCIFFVSSLCNPIIYSIRKRDFRTGVKNVLRRMGIYRSSNDTISDDVRGSTSYPGVRALRKSESLRRFHALFNVIGLPGNLLVIVTIALERRFHVMRYILLASLAVSDFLCLILVNSFRIASIAQEKWLYGQTMCYLNPFFLRYFYFNTILHLIAVSYERYNAIVKSPFTYDGTITKSKVVFIVLIWIVPIPFSIGPFLGLGNFVYNPEVFFCEQGWSVQSDSVAGNITFLAVYYVYCALFDNRFPKL
ncbi:hypothetical protein OS493_029525 [Desmophyllum pertusum]|uniref:G-protein coupled receptors family 1 profile domain-containing protein n=1 Tax=Desmophyllum pertusum TaxID=174260 RepID=A0A9X0CDC4_9CNID|nr:hypothetical protein OS493_029525 [Desmophyllum pertusum]